jgi:Tol biopolymer transport system component
MNRFKILFLGFLFIFGSNLLSNSASYASVSLGESVGISPFWDFNQIETENFVIIFPKELESTAQKAALYYEKAHQLLTPFFRWQPRTKTNVVLVDNADLANGMASGVLRIGMVLIMTPPDDSFSTSYYDDWLWLLVVHEYTHYLNMDTTRGYSEILRLIYGDVIRPNGLWPTWMLEGLAVYIETRRTGKGRGKSSFYEMVLRSSVDAKALNTNRHITLDRVSGGYPYAPGGEIPYLFGYQLMNQVRLDPENQKRKMTADEDEPVFSSEDLLGIMSKRSAGRIPFFINGNLENISDKDWYDYWSDFVSSTRKRMKKQLEIIESQPVTKPTLLTQKSFSALGNAVSPDGKWLAYNHASLDDVQRLYLRNLETGKVISIGKKMFGLGLSFSSDSKRLYFSQIERYENYYELSDLFVYDLESESTTQITNRLRARDPDISSDGKNLTFTWVKDSTVGLAVAKLKSNTEIETPEMVYLPNKFGAVYHPKFSKDGRKVIFGIHKNEGAHTEIMEYDRANGQARTLVNNGHFNRHPFYSPDGTVYFVSDLTGVDNIYRYRNTGTPELMTNIKTGIWFPNFSSDGKKIYGSVYSIGGWDLAEFSLLNKPVSTHAVKVEEAPAPRQTEEENKDFLKFSKASPTYEVTEYSMFSSLAPRSWAPSFFINSSTNWGASGTVSGFDSTFRHQYDLGFGYDAGLKRPGFALEYTNRVLGPVVTLMGKDEATGHLPTTLSSGRKAIVTTRQQSVAAVIARPLEFTRSVLVPVASVSRGLLKLYDPATSYQNPVGQFDLLTTADFQFLYSNAEKSRLAISTYPESGFQSQLGSRVYFEGPGRKVFKGIASQTHYLNLVNHTVFAPSVRGMWVSHRSGYAPANVRTGATSVGLIDSADKYQVSSFDGFLIRGYSTKTFLTKSAVIGSAELRVPLYRYFHGLGTNPFYGKNFYAFGFGQLATFPSRDLTSDRNNFLLPAWGGGIRFTNTVFIHIPTELSLEFHQGTKKSMGGQSQFSLSLQVAGR